MTTWREFVKETQKKYKISYKEAMQKASPLWKKKKGKKPDKKTRIKRSKKNVIEDLPEISEFPKPKEKKKDAVRKVIKPTVEQENLRDKRIKRRRARRMKKHSIMLDREAKSVGKMSGL